MGVGGLINAYKTAAADALEKNTIVQKIITQPVTLTFPYERTNEVMKMVADCSLNIISQEFTGDCNINGSIPVSLKDDFERKARLISRLTYNLP